MARDLHLHAEWSIKAVRSSITIAADSGLVVGKPDITRNIVNAVALDLGMPALEAAKIISQIPDPILDSLCFLNRLTRSWQYEFGEAYYLQNTRVIGPNFHSIERLLRTVQKASQFIPSSKLSEYLRRLSLPREHLSVMAEIQPVMWMDGSDVIADFEVPVVKATTIDWAICKFGCSRVLVEVKYRISDLIEGLEGISRSGVARAPSHDPSRMFLSIAHKFPNSSPSDQMQGIWIVSEVKQDADAFDSAFAELDAKRIHFCILSNWYRTAYIVARGGVKEADLSRFFGVSQDQDAHVFRLPRPQ